MEKPNNYNGCNNCIYQPEPLTTCERMRTDTLQLVCPSWEEKEVADGRNDTIKSVGY